MDWVGETSTNDTLSGKIYLSGARPSFDVTPLKTLQVFQKLFEISFGVRAAWGVTTLGMHHLWDP